MNILKELIYMLIFYSPLIAYMMNVPRMLHFMQLEGYKFTDFKNWLFKNPKVAFARNIPQFVAVLAFYIFITILNYFISSKLSISNYNAIFIAEYFAIVLLFAVPNIMNSLRDRKTRKSAKKPLIYTSRAKRLMFWNFVTVLLLELFFMGEYNSTIFTQMLKVVYYSFFLFALPLNMIIANFLADPTETIISNHYIRLAKWKLRKKCYKNLIKIGITGSYGKTSTKFILETILKEKYNVLATPESFNTTMGNVKVIREMLKPEHEVFISEMGARYRYEINEICDFVKPQIGVITSIGPQHLETFKKIENIVKTKAELIDSLPNDGFAILPNDNSHCLKLYNKEKRNKFIFSYGDKHSDVYAKDVLLTCDGLKFTAVTPNGEIKCISRLLGEHNVQNILGAIAVAIHLGLSNEEIARGVSKIIPISHRLEPINRGNGILVIDDAFNSNPVGSKMALDVIKEFKGRRIIITPGMVELGKDEEKFNREFGTYMATSVDIAILVGKRRCEPILEGLKSKKFSENNIIIVDSLDEATKKLNEIAKVNDVVLFENDLPDNYNEN